MDHSATTGGTHQVGPGPSEGPQVMPPEGPGGPIGPLDWFKILPSEPAASSEGLGWAGLQAARYRGARADEIRPPAMTHHRLVLFIRPPDELELQYDGVRRHVPP